jgi:hypothetical protein
MPWSAPQAIECFHLAFLATLRASVNPERYVLKGGANLRYFFGSQRYSEDIDLDIAADTDSLQGQVDAALRNVAFVLRSTEIKVGEGEITRPKQTPTTRRWKVPLIVPGFDDPVRTKIEFSARNGEARYELAEVPGDVVRAYGIVAPLTQHYLKPAAIKQKVLALAYRNQTQARDVFDLDLLFRGAAWDQNDVEREVRALAAEQATALPYTVFQDQVVPFLDGPIAVLYDERAWDQMQTRVVSELLR